jgi:hypothetical protein
LRRAHARDFTPTHATALTTPTPPPCFLFRGGREGSDRSERIGLCSVSSGSPLFKEGGSNARMNYACIDVDHPRPHLFSRERGVVLVLGWQAVRSRGGKENEKGGKGMEKGWGEVSPLDPHARLSRLFRLSVCRQRNPLIFHIKEVRGQGAR